MNKIQSIIAHVDQLIANQLNAIMHHPRFQQLEASWRGLHYLVAHTGSHGRAMIKIKVLDVSWLELAKDLYRAAEFDQSQLFHKIYQHEFGQPGGEPFGLLIGDYAISHRPRYLVSDLEILRMMAKIAAVAFAPFVTALAPEFLGVDDFAELDQPIDLQRTFQQAEYQTWKSLRQEEDARFLGLLLPTVLLRTPYRQQQALRHPFYFEEKIQQHSDYLWGNPAYTFAAVAARAFRHTGWFSEIRGLRRDELGGKIVDLPMDRFTLESSWAVLKSPVPVYITDQQEKALSDQGFIPLAQVAKSASVVFYECPSVQKFKRYTDESHTQSSQLSSMLHYVLCVSRFAHYLKVMAREKIGSFGTAQECEQYLQRWLYQYTAANTDLSDTLKTRYPLRDASVEVQERPGMAGNYGCVIRLSPHYQFDDIQTQLQLYTELPRGFN
jgi:type VI secretion system protein ImpD